MRSRPDWETGALFQAQILNRESRAKALDYLKTFLDANPKAQEVRLGYARQLINDKKFPEARVEFQRLLEDNPQNGDIAVTAGAAFDADERPRSCRGSAQARTGDGLQGSGRGALPPWAGQ